MKKRLYLFFYLFLCLLVSESSMATGILVDKLSSFCEEKAGAIPVFRKTLIYVDPLMMDEKDTSWILTLYKSVIEDNLLPAEMIQVLLFDYESLTVKEVFRSCYPNYTNEMIKSFEDKKENSGFFGGLVDIFAGDFKTELSIIQEEFRNRIVTALNKIQTIKIDNKKIKKKILEILKSDYARYQDLRTGISRIIIYSDLLQDSEKFSVSDYLKNISSKSEEENRRNLNAEAEFDKFQLDFKESELYVFSLSKRNLLGIDAINFDDFWKNFFLKSSALYAYSSNLSTSKIDIADVLFFEGEIFDSEENKTDIKLRLMVTSKGFLSNSWFFLRHEKKEVSLPLLETSTFKCNQDKKCTLVARIKESLVPNIIGVNDRINLETHEENTDIFVGKLTAPSGTRFEETDTPVKYKIVLKKTNTIF